MKDRVGHQVQSWRFKIYGGRKSSKAFEETTNVWADLCHYETGLLWKDEEVMLPNNRPLAEERLTNLERSLDKDSERAKAFYDTVET